MNMRLICGILISIAIHAYAFTLGAFKPASEDVQLQLDRGTISVELTLIPSIESAATPEPVIEPPPEEVMEEEPAEPVFAPEPVAEEIAPTPDPDLFIPAPAAPAKSTETLPTPHHPAAPLPQPEPVKEQTEAPLPPGIESKAQDGSPEQDKGLLTDAVAESGWKLAYPKLSRRRGEEGAVVLVFQVTEKGRAKDIQIRQSSGIARLDNAALRAISKATFTPARQNGIPVASTQTKTILFRLD